MNSLIHTFVARPYVVAFLCAFLVLAIFHFGVLRTLGWILVGTLVAFLSEYSSIHNGFPYGLYHYLYDAMRGEIMIGGVPIWDSISYVFIAYASYATAWFFVENIEPKSKLENYISPASPVRVVLIASILMMLADVIIDPVANLGDRWFLGKIYFYPEGGIYFGVPLSNFGGWWLVAMTLYLFYAALEKWVFTPLQIPMRGAFRFKGQALLGPLFYFSIAAFNVFIAFWIGEQMLAWTCVMILLPLVTLFLHRAIR